MIATSVRAMSVVMRVILAPPSWQPSRRAQNGPASRSVQAWIAAARTLTLESNARSATSRQTEMLAAALSTTSPGEATSSPSSATSAPARPSSPAPSFVPACARTMKCRARPSRWCRVYESASLRGIRRSGISTCFVLTQPEDALELGIEDAFAEGIIADRMADRLGALLPANRLDVDTDAHWPPGEPAGARSRAEPTGGGGCARPELPEPRPAYRRLS